MFVKALGIVLYDLIPGTMYELGVQIVKDSQATPFSESVFNQQTLVHNYSGCLQNQANKIPGFLQDFQEFFKQFSRICLHKMSTVIQETLMHIIMKPLKFKSSHEYVQSINKLLTNTVMKKGWWMGWLAPSNANHCVNQTKIRITSLQFHCFQY